MVGILKKETKNPNYASRVLMLCSSWNCKERISRLVFLRFLFIIPLFSYDMTHTKGARAPKTIQYTQYSFKHLVSDLTVAIHKIWLVLWTPNHTFSKWWHFFFVLLVKGHIWKLRRIRLVCCMLETEQIDQWISAIFRRLQLEENGKNGSWILG